MIALARALLDPRGRLGRWDYGLRVIALTLALAAAAFGACLWGERHPMDTAYPTTACLYGLISSLILWALTATALRRLRDAGAGAFGYVVLGLLLVFTVPLNTLGAYTWSSDGFGYDDGLARAILTVFDTWTAPPWLLFLAALAIPPTFDPPPAKAPG